MAYSADQWARAKFLFELGYSLRAIEDDCGISMGQVGKRSRKDGWKKDTDKQAIKSDVMDVSKKMDTLESEKDTVVSKLLTLDDFEVAILHEKVTEELGIRSLITNTQALAVIRANESLKRGTKTVMLKETQYANGKPVSDTYTPYEVPIDTSDVKGIVEAVDKASITLKVSERHAPKQQINIEQNTVSITDLVRERHEKLKAKGIILPPIEEAEVIDG